MRIPFIFILFDLISSFDSFFDACFCQPSWENQCRNQFILKQFRHKGFDIDAVISPYDQWLGPCSAEPVTLCAMLTSSLKAFAGF
jgi:hypothetical protein